MYELGYYINGAKYRVWHSEKFPPAGVHDMLFASQLAFQTAFPETRVHAFMLHNGEPYSI